MPLLPRYLQEEDAKHAEEPMNDRPKITQDMINLYDEYTHLTLDRRGFMEKLGRLTGSAAVAAAIAPLLSANQAQAAIVPEDDKRVVARRIEYPGATGVVMKGYLVVPASTSGPLPAVIVIHENRGLNAHVEDVARRMALEGFLALAPDLLSPAGGTPADEDQARTMISALDPAQTVQNAVATVDYLRNDAKQTTGKVGAIGFCWGGGVVNQLAVASPDLMAGVSYYGAQPKAGIGQIKARLLLHFAGLDDRTNAGIKDYEAALQAAGIDYKVYIYEGANHAFNNDTSAARYDKKTADLAWSRTTAFLKETLG
jgi:carboxymethylenebutenolidase